MRTIVIISAMLLGACTFAAAQEGGQRTPPGGDMVGSDRPAQRGDIRSTPTASPDANQRMTNSAGSSTGYEKVPGYAGTSTRETGSAQQSPGTTGMEGSVAATAARRRARSGSGLGTSPSADSSSQAAGRNRPKHRAQKRRRRKRGPA